MLHIFEGESGQVLTINLGTFNEGTVTYSNGVISIEIANRNKLHLLKREFKSDEQIVQLTQNRLQTVEELYIALSTAIKIPEKKGYFIEFIETKEELLLKATFVKVFNWNITFERVECDVEKRLELIWKKIDASKDVSDISDKLVDNLDKVHKIDEQMEKQVGSLSKFKEEFNEMKSLISTQNESVGNQMKELNQKMNFLLKSVVSLCEKQEKIEEKLRSVEIRQERQENKILMRFYRWGDVLKISESGKLATHPGSHGKPRECQHAWCGALVTPQTDSNGVHEYSFRILQHTAGRDSLSFGFVSPTIDLNTNLYRKQSSWLLM